VVGHARQPLQRVQCLEVAAERWIHAGPVQHGLLAVEVDEFLQRKRVPDDVTRDVLDGLLVLESNSSSNVRRETRMAPREELTDKVLRDRVPKDETGQQALAEQLHDRLAVPILERVKSTLVRKRAIGREDVSVWMPLYRTSYFWRLLSLPERVGLPLLSSPREDRVPVSTVLPFPDLSGRGLLPVFRDSIWFFGLVVVERASPRAYALSGSWTR